MSTTGAPARSGEPRPLRADAQRNYQRLLSAASATFAEHSADDASLEEIARRAGGGMGAVYRDQVDVLSDRAKRLSESADPGAALAEWLRALVNFGRTKRSLSSALLATLDKDSEFLSACSLVIRESAGTLLSRAQQAGVVRADADAKDLLRLVHAISMAVEREPADVGQADRLLGFILDGLRQPPLPSA